MRFAWLLLLALAAAPGHARQDDIAVRGRIIGPDGAPLAGHAVVLHRVSGSEGATVAETQSSATGEFELPITGARDSAALYFVATRYQGELYIGSPFRTIEAGVAPQIIQVGIPGTSATALLNPGAAPQPVPGSGFASRNWLLFVIPLLGIAVVIIYMLVPRGRLPRERALLIRVAELDERMPAAPAGQRDAMARQRLDLMTRLRAG